MADDLEDEDAELKDEQTGYEDDDDDEYDDDEEE
jgi:hypothetical protein